MQKNRVYTFLSIAGLAIGIAATILIFRILQFESGFNKGFSNYDRIGRIVSSETRESGKGYTVCIPIPAMDIIAQNTGIFEKVARIKEGWNNITVPNPNGGGPVEKFAIAEGETAIFTENSFFDIFDLPWLAGDRKSALSAPGSIVLTKRWALKCFEGVDDDFR